MKNILISILIGLFTVTASIAATEEYRTFTIPFKQSKDAEKVIIEIPSYPLEYESNIKLPEPGIYVLNKPEVLRRELEKASSYYILPGPTVNLILILGFWAIVALAMFTVTYFSSKK